MDIPSLKYLGADREPGLCGRKLMYNSKHLAKKLCKFEFTFPVTMCLHFKDFPDQFLSHLESAKPVF